MWKKLKDYDYEVSDNGDVRHYKHKKIRKQRTIDGGYKAVKILNKTTGKYRLVRVHRLVAEAFLGDTEGMLVDHINRNRIDNHVSNLRLATGLQNAKNRSHCETCSCVFDIN